MQDHYSVPLQQIGEEMLVQSNRATQYPLFIVVETKKVYGIREDSSDGSERLPLDLLNESHLCEECQTILAQDKDLPDECDSCDTEAFVHYRIEKNVPNLSGGVFLTAKACQDHIDSNHYHYEEPSVYAVSAWRNPEMVKVMQAIISLTGKAIPSHYL